MAACFILDLSFFAAKAVIGVAVKKNLVHFLGLLAAARAGR